MRKIYLKFHTTLIAFSLVHISAWGNSLLMQQTNPTNSTQEQASSPRESSWLALPLLSSNPKLATAAGVLAAYVHTFDEKSRTSMFGLAAKYSTTDSLVANLFAKTSFKEDHHRIVAGMLLGEINNEYQNYLDTGRTVNTEDKIRAAFLRYLYRLSGNWLAGLQASATNYELLGKSAAEDDLLDQLGLVGFESQGLGLVLLYDTRDNDFKPTRGWYLNANNLTYQESDNVADGFTIYRLDIRYYRPHGQGHVFALRQRNQGSQDAPRGAYSPVYLRGYTPGEFLAQNMSSLELEERYSIAEKWTATGFVGLAKIYGEGSDQYDETLFPAIGLGLQYIIKPKEGIVGNLEYAVGRDDNNGLYLKMGYSF